MRKIVLTSLLLFFLLGCNKENKDNGFSKSELGFEFKKAREIKDSPKARVGDIICGQMQVKLNDSILLYSNYGTSDRLFKIFEPRKGSIDEFLLSTHIGDSLIMIAPADSVAKYVSGINYRTQDKLYFYLTIDQIISKQELTESQKKLKEQEKQELLMIDDYLTRNKLKAQTQESGLLFVPVVSTNGAKAEIGKTVKVNYVVSYLDGKIIDTNIKKIAQKAGIYDKDRVYAPFEFVLGDDGVIAGLIEGVMLMNVGSRAKMIIPSRLAYAENGFGNIPPFTPLVFEVTLLEVN